jgi:hypothetical protein
MDALQKNIVVEDLGGDLYHVESPFGPSLWRREVRSITDHVPTSAAPSGAWSVWAVAMHDNELARKAFRWLGRYRLEYPDRVLGPYDPTRMAELAATRTDDDGKALAELWPAGGVPWVIFGDDPAGVRAEVYAPKDADIAADTDVAEDAG